MTTDKRANSPTFLHCSRCSGQGFVTDQRGRAFSCPACHGVGSVGLVKGELVRYGETFSRAALSLEHVQALLRALIDGAFILFGLVGLYIGYRELASLNFPIEDLPRFVFRQTPGMAVFWLSILGDLYVFYRLEQETHQPRRLRDLGVMLENPPTRFEEIGSQPVRDLSPLLSRTARLAVKNAWLLADKLQHGEADDRHLFSSLLTNRDIIVMFARLGIGEKSLLERSSRLLQTGLAGRPTELGQPVHEAIVRAYAYARERNAKAIDPSDLLVGLGEGEGAVRDVFDDLAIDTRKLKHVAVWLQMNRELRQRWQSFRGRAALKPKGVMDRAMTAQATPVLAQFSHDLTQLARAGALPLVVDREQEIASIFRALEGKANAVLVGNPGVGKTAIVEGIANRMVSEDVPDVLQDKRLVSLSVAALVAGAGAVGELEQRFTEILDEVIKSGNIVLFIDNIQNLVGVSSTGGHSMDLSGILSQALTTRRFFVIATTTFTDYTRYIEQSSGFVTTFTKVEVPEMDKDATLLVLEATSGHVEYSRKIFFSFEALEKTVELASRYIHDHFQPQKSMDLLDEVAIAAHKRKGKGALVTGQDVAAVVSEKTHVEVREVTQAESEKLLHLEDAVHERVIGQDEAVTAVASALRRARAELRDPNRPIATFLFLGPTGVGKTELAKTVAATYFGSDQTMVRLDMSEYQEPASLYRMIGAPPGFGSGEGYLTEAIRRNPFSLILLDELEKAHPDILNIFLQVMDDGRLTDSTGRTVDFTNAIIIATSNAGTDVIQQRMREGASTAAIKNELINERLSHFFRPEFLNRFDAIIVFKPLTQNEIQQIAGLLLEKISEQLAEKGIHLRATTEAISEIAAAGFDPIFGARPLRRAIQENVDNALANYLLTGKLGRRDVAVLEAGGKISVEKAKAL